MFADELPVPSPSSRPKRRRSAPDTAVAGRAREAPYAARAPCCCEPKLTQVEQRIMIKGYYVQVLKCPPQEEWWGEEGAVWTAVEALDVADYRTVESVFATLLEDPALDVSQRRSGSGGHNAKIKDGTTECDVLMGASGAGAGQRWTASLITENSDVDVVQSTVSRTMDRLEALTTKRGSFPGADAT